MSKKYSGPNKKGPPKGGRGTDRVANVKTAYGKGVVVSDEASRTQNDIMARISLMNIQRLDRLHATHDHTEPAYEGCCGSRMRGARVTEIPYVHGHQKEREM